MYDDIKPFKDNVFCDVSPLEICDVILRQPYMWTHHVVYESRPHSVIITLGGQIYRVLEVVPTIVISLIFEKQCQKEVSQNRNFFLFMVKSKGERKVTTTTKTSTGDLST
jgi:hypothetical protein